jgi:membrane protein implicated in regulation of membrane protease activity
MRTSRRAVWTAAAVGLLVVGALAIGVWSGVCVDYAAIPGECTVEPALGWPGAILVAVVCAACAALCLRRATRRSVTRRAAAVDPDRPPGEDRVTPR